MNEVNFVFWEKPSCVIKGDFRLNAIFNFHAMRISEKNLFHHINVQKKLLLFEPEETSSVNETAIIKLKKNFFHFYL